MLGEDRSIDADAEDSGDEPDRWTVIRDIGVFQVKLIFDGLRDLILVPVSLVLGAISLISPGKEMGGEFYKLLRLGKRSERWINLFGAADKAPAHKQEFVRFPEEDIDAMVSRVETFVVDEYQKGGVTQQAKERLDKAIDSLQKLASRNQQPPPGS